MLFLIYTSDTIPGASRAAFLGLCMSSSRSLSAAPFSLQSHPLVITQLCRSSSSIREPGTWPGTAPGAVSGDFGMEIRERFGHRLGLLGCPGQGQELHDPCGSD